MSGIKVKRSWLDRPIASVFPKFTAETILFAIIIILAIVSRLYNLGVRVMSHDESLHAYYSWQLFQGNGYQHNPMMHGPLQFHLIALTFFLFGDTDFTARLPHAIASILMVIMLWKWRRYLGRPGMLVAAGLAVISPYLLYYGRYARNETFVALFGVLTLYAILRYFETGKHRYLFLLTAATVLHFTVKETAFIYTAQALLFLAIYFVGRVIRNPWGSHRLYNAFIAALSVGVLLLGSTLGLIFYNRVQTGIDASQTSAPLVPGEALIPLTAEVPQVSLVTGLAIGALAAFIIAGICLVCGYGWKRIRAERSFDILMLLGTFVLPQLTALPVTLAGKNPLTYVFVWPGWDIRALLHNDMIVTGIFLFFFIAMSIAIGLWWNKSLWLGNAALFYGIYVFFYTTFFTNWTGFFTGIIGSLGYWLVQQGVQRGGQPWYYYILIQIPMYEFLPALGLCLAVYFGLRHRNPLPHPGEAPREHTKSDSPAPGLSPSSVASGQSPTGEAESEGNHTFSLLFWWSISSLFALSIAGEKMPWLTVHITLPMILLTGWALGQVIERTDWMHVRQHKGLLIAILMGIFLTSLLMALNTVFSPTPPFQGKNLVQLHSTTRFLTAALIAIGSLVSVAYQATGWEVKQLFRLGVLTFFGMLAVLTARAAIRASFIHYDDATEYMVYAHGARGVKNVMEQIETISERTAGGHNLVIAYDSSAPDMGVAWPFTWYLRDYPNARSFPQPTTDLRADPVIIVDVKNFDTILPIVDDTYYHFDYLRIVWPNQDYFNLTWSNIAAGIKNPKMLAAAFQIWLNRDYCLYSEVTGKSTLTLANWSPSDEMKLYVRRDVAEQIWEYGIASPISVQVDPYEQGTITLSADLIFGAPGQTEGQFNAPRAVAIAPDESLYIADSRNHRIQHLDANGKVLKVWGEASPGCPYPGSPPPNVPLGTFCEPWGVAVSPDGQWVYVADTWNHRIQKFTSEGTPVTAWGYANFGQNTDPFGFWGPRGIAVDSFGRVYITDTGNKRILIYDADGNFINQFGTAGMEPGQFDEPVGLALDAQGNLYAVDTWNQRVQVFTPGLDGMTFTPLVQWDIAGWYGQSTDNKPFIAVDNLGRVFVTDPESYRVLEFTPEGEFVNAWGDFGSGLTNFGLASGIAVDSQGRVWVSDADNNRLMRFTLPVETIASPIVPIPSSVVSPSPSAETFGTCQVSTGYENGNLYLRVCAGMDCTVIGWIPEGSLVSLLPAEPIRGWTEVQWGSLTGWVYSGYCPKQPAP